MHFVTREKAVVLPSSHVSVGKIVVLKTRFRCKNIKYQLIQPKYMHMVVIIIVTQPKVVNTKTN